MATERKERPFLVFRKTRANRYTLPVLLGCIEKEGLAGDFGILIAESLEEMIHRAGPREAIIAFSFMTPHLGQIRGEVERLRNRLHKDSLFLAGGSHPSGDPKGTLRAGLDFVFAGASERTFPDFLRQVLRGKLPGERILRDEKASHLPLDHPQHSLEHRFFSPIEITRGCPYRCAFCQTPRIWGHSLRHRSPENLGRVLQKVIPFGYLHSKFISPNAFSYGSTSPKNPDLRAIEAFLAACQGAGIQGIHYGCYPSEVRPDWVNPDVLELVKKYCQNKTIVLGAQSGSNSLLAKLQRGHTAEEALNAVRWIRRAGFLPHVDFVFGFPEETLEDRQITLRMMEEMIANWGAKIHAHTYLPIPGTPLFQKDPSPLDEETKNALLGWEKKKKLDGWWKDQEIMAWKIVEWRDQGWIGEED